MLQKIKSVIFEDRVGQFQFSDMDKFEERIASIGNSTMAIVELFGEDFRQPTGRDNLYRIVNGLRKEDQFDILAKKRHVKGVYIWYHDGEPFYVGISRKIAKRLHQHITGKSHYSASLAYKIAYLVHGFVFDEEAGEDQREVRANFSKAKIKEIQDWLKQQQVAFVEIEDNDELALFEIFCSMHFKTVLNSFETS